MLSSHESTDQIDTEDFMCRLLVSNALLHRTGQIGAADMFSALALERLGLINRTGGSTPPDDLVDILLTPTHEKRLPFSSGPLLFVRNGPSQSSIVSPSELLASDRPELRLAAAQYFDQLPRGMLSKRSRQTLSDARQEIAISDPARWMPVCRRVEEFLRDDIYLVLAGFKQSYSSGFEDGVDRYLQRLMRPDGALLLSLDLEVWDPVSERDSVERVVARAALEDSLEQAMDEYYRVLGHFPLTSSVGVGSLIKSWKNEHGDKEIWSSLWGWADKQSSPLPRFHVSVACLSSPEIVPEGLEAIFWGELAELSRGRTANSSDSRWSEAWSVRESLAQHLGNQLSFTTPGFASERVYGTAWWLTERICEAFPTSSSLLQQIRQLTIAPELDRSTYVGTVTHPHIGQSGLRYLTLATNRVWSTSIVCELGNSIWHLASVHLLPTDRERLEQAILITLAQAYPPPGGRPSQTFGFDLPIESLVANWSGDQSEVTEKALIQFNSLLQFGQRLFSGEGISDIVDGLTCEESEAKERLAQALLLRSYTTEIASELSDLLFTSQRWKKLVSCTNTSALGHICTALTEVAVQVGGKWASEVPHIFAYGAENAISSEHRRTLFTLTIWACLGTCTVGALDRLMYGSFRSEFIPIADHWHGQLNSILSNTTPWAAGRIRAVLSNLIADEIPTESHAI